MKETQRRLLKTLNPHLLCVLCAGYYIDPTTIVECLHSFCRSCIVKYLETSRFCPICDVQLHKTKPLLSIRRDKILERLVYKIVPGLYAKEMVRRALPKEELYLSPDDQVSLVMQYHFDDLSSQTPNGEDSTFNQDLKVTHKKFLNCPAAVTIELLKKFIILKYSLTDQHQVEIIYNSERLPDDLSLIDVAYCFEWKQTSPMELDFEILEKSTVAVPIVEEVESVEDVDMDEEDSHSVASSSLPFMSSKSFSECDDASNTSLDSKPLIERLESEKTYQKRKREREVSDDEPEQKKSLFDSLLQSTLTTNNNENEDKDFQESDEDYSKYEQDIEEIIEEDDDDDDIGRLRISSNVSEDEINNDETTSQMFVIAEAIEEEKYEKVQKEKHWKPEGRNRRKNKKAKHHHHHKRRVSQSPPPTATIVHSPDRDIMKLKVKLNTLPGYRHKEDKHHRHSKHFNGSVSSASSIMSSPSRSSYKEDDAVLSEQSCDSIILPKKYREEIKSQAEKQPVGEVRKSQVSRSQAICESPKSDTSSCKEPVQQMRSVRPKSKPAAEQQSNSEQSHKMIIMPPSSITVSIITAEEKMKMEKDKSLMLSGNHDFENKRPSLEIVRVNGPPSSSPSPVEVPKASPKPKEQHEEQSPSPPRPKTKKPVPAVIPIKSAKPSITIITQNRSFNNGNINNNANNNNNISNSNNNNNNNSNKKHDEMKTSVTISLENGSQNDSALDLSGKSSRKDNGGQQQHYSNNNNKCTPSHVNGGGHNEPPGMRNLMTLSDTAVHIRNMMSSSPCMEQQQQLDAAKKRFGNNNHVGNGNGAGNGMCSPKRHCGSVPLRIPVPPASGTFAKTSVISQNKQVKGSAVAAAARVSDTKPKHGPPNQTVRHIPNPSVLLFRNHHQQLAQFAAAAAANAVAVNQQNKRPSPTTAVTSRIPPMPAAIPLHSIRKMENMTKNIEKVAAGLSVKANALYKQNFIENGRARVELPS